jgi:hypothetical protein
VDTEGKTATEVADEILAELKYDPLSPTSSPTG